MAERLGVELMPWQRLVAEVGGELDPETGLPAFREVIVTVPRQSGKTHLVLCWEVQRGLGWETPQRIVYSAQTGNDARKKLIEDQTPILEPRKAKLGIRRILRGMGNEAVEFRNGSRITLLASTAESGHGKTIDLGVKDEFFADWDDRRDQTLIPAMATRPAAQVLTTSTMGTDESGPLNRAVARGREAAAAGRTSGIAYFEWSADPEDDPDDPAVWWSCMPALGLTITEDVVRHARETLTDGEFRRAFLNISTSSDERVIPASAWAQVCSTSAAPSGRVVFGLDVNPERSAGSIAAGSPGVLELVDHRPGIGWIVGRAKELHDRWGSVFLVDQTGPAGSLVPDLERAGVSVRPVAPRDLVNACGGFYDAVMESRVAVRSHNDLDDAVAAAAKRAVGDAWAWTRKHTAADVSPLVAVTLAWWGSANVGDGPSVYEDRGMVAL